MRVISGIAGGIPLVAPKIDIRPTMDRVKGAIFSSLEPGFAGLAGARSLRRRRDAGNRGAEPRREGGGFCGEGSAGCGNVIRRNLEKTRLTAGIVQVMDVFSYLDRLAPKGALISSSPILPTRRNRASAISRRS